MRLMLRFGLCGRSSRAPGSLIIVVERTLNEQEMVDILEDIARNGGNAAARIAAIKVLREMDAGEKPTEDTVAQLYAVGNPGRMRAKRVA